MKASSPLPPVLVEEGLTPAQVDEAVEHHVLRGGSLDSAVLELGLLDETRLIAAMSKAFGLPAASPERLARVDAGAVGIFPERLASMHKVLPLELSGRRLSVAVCGRPDLALLDELGFMLSVYVKPYVTTESALLHALHRVYGVALDPRVAALRAQLASAVSDGDVEAAAREAAPLADPAATDVGSASSDAAAKESSAEDHPGASAAAEASSPPPPVEVASAPAADEFDVAQEDEDEDEDAAAATAPADDSSREEVKARLLAEAEAAGARAAQSASARTIERVRWTVDEAIAELALADDRDAMVDVVLRFAYRRLQCAAMFTLQRHGDGQAFFGWDIIGEGLERKDVEGIIIPVDGEHVLAKLYQMRSPFLGPLPDDDPLEAALGRGPRAVLLIPVFVGEKLAAALYGDGGDGAIPPASLAELHMVAPRFGKALRNLILRKKRAAGVASEPEPELSGMKMIPVAEATGEVPAIELDLDEFDEPTREQSPDESKAVSTEVGDSVGDVRIDSSLAREPEPPTVQMETAVEPGVAGLPSQVKFSPPVEEKPDDDEEMDEPTVELEAPPVDSDGDTAPTAPSPGETSEPSVEEEAASVAQPGAPTSDEDVADEETQEGQPLSSIDSGEPEVVYSSTREDSPTGFSDSDEPTIEVDPELLVVDLKKKQKVFARLVRDETADTDTKAGHGPKATFGATPAVLPSLPKGFELGFGSDDDDGEEPTMEVDPSLLVDGLKAKQGAFQRLMKPAPRPAAQQLPDARLPMVSPGARAKLDALRATYQSWLGHEDPAVDTLLGELAMPGETGRNAQSRLIGLELRAMPSLARYFPGALNTLPFGQLDARPDVREMSDALYCLVRLGPDLAAPILVSAIEGDDRNARYAATWALSELTVPAAMPLLAQRVFDPEIRIAYLACDVLLRYREHAAYERVLEQLRDLLKRGDEFQRARAVLAMGELKDKLSIISLAELLGTRPKEIAEDARVALIDICKQDFGTSTRRWKAWYEENKFLPRTAWLIEGLAHRDEEVRRRSQNELNSLTGHYFGYHFDAPRAERDQAVTEWRRWWNEASQTETWP